MNDTTHFFFKTTLKFWRMSVAIAVRRSEPARNVQQLRNTGWHQIDHQEARRVPMPGALLTFDPAWRKAGLARWVNREQAYALRRLTGYSICNNIQDTSSIHFLKRYFSYRSADGKNYVICLPADTEEYIVSRIKNGAWAEIGVARILILENVFEPNGQTASLARFSMEEALPLRVRSVIRDLDYEICTPKKIRGRGIMVSRRAHTGKQGGTPSGKNF